MPERVCPVWIGYILASPIRKLFQNPKKLLSPYVREGMTVLDIGSAMGFFSIPMAQMVGPRGKVICVDLQEKMLEGLMKRAGKACVADRITPRRCKPDSLEIADLAGTVDFALASAVVHEVPSADTLFREVFAVLKPGGILEVAEPAGHVNAADFAVTVAAAEKAGFQVQDSARFRQYHQVILRK
jgi:ubiquinone/menaquinone biosynthesis C-methylase UbiE